MAAIPRGRFVWHDLMTSDPKAAERFYTEVAGWGTQPWDGPMPYTMWTAGGTPLGGVMQLPPDAQTPPHWLAYVSTPDIEATVDQAKKLGGNRARRADGNPECRAVRRSQGSAGSSVCRVHARAREFGHDGAPRIGEFSWHELATTDSAAAFRFYARSCSDGRDRGAFDMGGGWMYQMYGRNRIRSSAASTSSPQRCPARPRGSTTSWWTT